MRILYSIWFPRTKALEITVEDGGKARRVVLRLRVKGQFPPPPSNWGEQAIAELGYQDSVPGWLKTIR